MVYGGTGKAARDWPIVRPDRRARCARWATTRPSWCSRASRWACSAPIPMRRGSCSPTRIWWGAGPPGRCSASSRRRGLMMYGQMTAGSWIYIGTQGILQGTYETLRPGRTHPLRHRRLSGRLVVSGGLGGMGGAQPLGGDDERRGVSRRWRWIPSERRRRVEHRYLDAIARDLDEALDQLVAARTRRQAALGGGDRQRGRRLPRAGAPRRPPRPGHRPDLCPRPAQRLRAAGAGLTAGRRAAAHPARGARASGPGLDGRPGPGHARHEGAGAATSSTTATTSAPARRPQA